MKLKTKLQLSFLLIGFLSIIAISWQVFENARSAIEQLTFDRLTSIRETKKRQIESYFQQIHNQVVTLSEDRMITDAMKQYALAFNMIPFSNRDSLRDAGRGKSTNQSHFITEYRSIDTIYQPILESYRHRFGYDDIFLVDADSGYVVCSVLKKNDFATSLLNGVFSGTNIASVFYEARKSGRADFVKLVDFAPYAGSNYTPVSFIASPIYDNGKLLGVLIFQIPIALVNQVMTSNNNWEAEGFGQSGESYIVGSDYTMRTDSRFYIQRPEDYFNRLEKIGTNDSLINKIRSQHTSILLQEVKTQATNDALQGKTDTKIINDYRGIPVLSSYTPLNIPGVNWVMLAEIDASEAFSSVQILRERLILLGLVILLFFAFIGMVIARMISRPILQLTKAAGQFGEGNYAVRADVLSNDEIGLLAAKFNSMAEHITENTVQLKNEIAERRRVEQEVKRSHQELRNLSAHLQTVREEERKGLAREIHDELGQALTTLKLHLAVIKSDVQPTSAQASDKITRLLELIDTTIKSVKRMIAALRPRLLDDLGLTAAIEWQAEEFQQRTGIYCKLSITPEEIKLDSEHSIALFRIFQETLTNISRHSKATAITVKLTEQDRAVELKVVDNGIGIKEDQLKNSKSFGLMGIRERASYWGGEVHIFGIKGEGTTVIVNLPNKKGEKA